MYRESLHTDNDFTIKCIILSINLLILCKFVIQHHNIREHKIAVCDRWQQSLFNCNPGTRLDTKTKTQLLHYGYMLEVTLMKYIRIYIVLRCQNYLEIDP